MSLAYKATVEYFEILSVCIQYHLSPRLPESIVNKTPERGTGRISTKDVEKYFMERRCYWNISWNCTDWRGSHDDSLEQLTNVLFTLLKRAANQRQVRDKTALLVTAGCLLGAAGCSDLVPCEATLKSCQERSNWRTRTRRTQKAANRKHTSPVVTT